MELSVVRIHKAGTSGGQPWVQARPVVRPDNYLSQCPFILLNEESHPPLSEFPIHSHRGVVTVTLAVEGSVEQTDRTGTHWHLAQGDATFSTGGGVMQGATSSEQGVRLLHLWINLPATFKGGRAHHQVVRHEDASRANFGDASVLLYAGTLGMASGPHADPWPVAVADLSLQAGKLASLPLTSTERSFAYILSGDIELGRNQVRLNRGHVAWFERTVRPEGINTLTLRAEKETRILLFSSPVFGEGESAAGGSSTDCASDAAEDSCDWRCSP
jgi:redox-sensitive bicupin YhaK (pirin superfamily)